ncbi:G-type lectin S-receptor-like serine/threonine-protein kinase At4g27290 [Zingiber officinale]|uniref:G-type lectin S-receptor-like serine/threonine-protein kinase At4g27290 n=1 Tax=Zingiber officinale TaxID=94328 RepID=UPI001C4B23F9|nr:G-type lectin S-receptor-like serine/threonine-protein kinase At4g27290 [Zingiber officinale]
MQLRISCKPSIFLLLRLLLSTGLVYPAIDARNILIPGQPLYDDGTTLISSGGRFELGFFSPTASRRRYVGIWYRNISQTPVWVANRSSPIYGRSGLLLLSGEGTLIVTAINSSTVNWSSSNLTRLTNPKATLFDDGNFAVREAGNDDPDSFAWQSFDFPTDTLLPGMKLGWNLTSGLNRQLTSWASASDPSPGGYTLGIDLQGDPQLFVWFRSQPLWRGGRWNGLYFTGAPGMDDPLLFNATFVVDPRQVIYSFSLRDPSIGGSVLVVDYSGELQRLDWMDGAEVWDVDWSMPKDPCDTMSACGANAVCDPNARQMCRCLAAFLVNNASTWDPSNPNGCSRISPLNCGNSNGTGAFFKFSRSKLPDTSISVVDRRSTSLDQCRESCMKNCSCNAYASSDISESESGCIMWMGDITDLRLYSGAGGQDLYVRMTVFNSSNSQDGTSNRSSRRSHLAVTIAVPALAVFLLVCVTCCVCRRRKRNNSNAVKEIEEEDLDLPLFDLDTVLDATNNFAAENKLGQGGFGPVYKGRLGDGQEIAVKRLSKTSTQGIDEFKNEVVIIAKLQHQNLVRLLGCCIQGGERTLIYEYMPNGSLDAFLFDEEKRMLLDWKTRYDIIVGIARGLLYLHHDSRLKIIHRDMKASNILLDKDNIPKISDFGLARIFRGDEMEINTRKVVGTYGYMSPEYGMNGIFSIKSDVFSFGVLILEIISGKKNRGAYQSDYLNLLGHIWSLWEEGKSVEIVDKSIGSFSIVEVTRCIKIGLLCVQDRPQDRPTMSLVVTMLSSDSTIPEPKQPCFVVALDSSNSLIGKQYPPSINNVSNTTLEGR